jgi:hypothetical protein
VRKARKSVFWVPNPNRSKELQIAYESGLVDGRHGLEKRPESTFVEKDFFKIYSEGYSKGSESRGKQNKAEPPPARQKLTQVSLFDAEP